MSLLTNEEPEEEEPETLHERLAKLIAAKKDATAVRILRQVTGLGIRECTQVINGLKKPSSYRKKQ